MLIGQTLRNRYQIQEKIGSGGFGETYLAIDLDLPGTPQCVVKQLSPKNTSPDLFIIAQNLFTREAQMLHRLGENQQIPRLYAYFTEGGHFYLIQEFIKGHDLTKEIIPSSPLSEEKIIHLLQEILFVLSIVHQEKIIHRDIKPPNIMRRQEDGQLMLIDFGAVKSLGGLELTSTGETTLTVAIGSPGYMPCEQASGQPKLASDVYAVGMIAIQGLTGLTPNELEEDLDTGEIVWLPFADGVSNSLAMVLNKMIAYDYRQRYQSATEALLALNQLTETPNPTQIPILPVTTITTKQSPTATGMGRGRFLQLALLAGTGLIGILVIESLLPKKTTVKAQNFIENLGNEVDLDMIAIGGGTFLMGSPENEEARSYDESPQHYVTVPAFYMGKYPITQAQWQAIMGNNPSYFQGDTRPVEMVSWIDCQEFCQKLSAKTGKQYRLPSEAEWEYAARAGTKTRYFFGKDDIDLKDYAWYVENSNKQTHPVGQKKANPWGLYDILGNVWEWCQDDWQDSYEGAPTDGSARLLNNGVYPKLLRGGFWRGKAYYSRSAHRNRITSHVFKNNYNGFRVVCLQ